MPNNWRTARFDGSHHLPECTEVDCGGKCSAEMAQAWRRDVQLVESLCERADSQAPIHDGAPVSLMAEQPTAKVEPVSNHELVYGEGAGL